MTDIGTTWLELGLRGIAGARDRLGETHRVTAEIVVLPDGTRLTATASENARKALAWRPTTDDSPSVPPILTYDQAYPAEHSQAHQPERTSA